MNNDNILIFFFLIWKFSRELFESKVPGNVQISQMSTLFEEGNES